MKFSVITINYNNADGLRRTIESVKAQTCHDYEYIIIDGGSTDNSPHVIREYADDIDYWVSERDGGIYNAMNKGTRQAHGEYCIFMNSGDCFYNCSVLSEIKGELAEKASDILVGKIIASDTHRQLTPPPLGAITMYHLYSGAIPHQGTFVRRSLQDKYPFDESLKISSDWKFFLQCIIFDNCEIQFTNTVVALYDTMGVSSQNPSRMWEEKEKVLAQFLPSRVIADYRRMKACECLTQTLTPQLRRHYTLDRMVFYITKTLLIFFRK